MMPFGGFIQAVAGAAPASVHQPAGPGKACCGTAVNSDAAPGTQDHTASFPAWVRSLMEDAAKGPSSHGIHEVSADGFIEQTPDGPEADNAELDQLSTVDSDTILPSMGKASDMSEDPSVFLIEGENGTQPNHLYQQDSHGVVPTAQLEAPMVAGAVLSVEGDGRSAADGGHTQTAAETKIPAIVSQQAEAPARDRGDESGQVTSRSVATTADFKVIPADAKLTPTLPDAEPEPSMTRAKTDPQGDHRVASDQGAMTQSDARLTSAAAPRPPQTDILRGSIADAKDVGLETDRQPHAPNTAQTDNPSSSTDDDAGRFRESARGHSLQRNDVAPMDENEWHGSQAADSAKSNSVEHGRSQATVQDVARSDIGGKASTAQAQAATRVADFTDKQLSTSVMDQIVDKASLRSIGGRSEIQIRLKPDFLGNVQMNIATDRDQLIVRVMTDQAVVKDIIETHLHQLKAELQNQGLTIDKFEVMVNPDADHQHQREQFAQMFKQPSSQHGRRQAREQGQENPQQEGGHLAADDESPDGDGISYFA